MTLDNFFKLMPNEVIAETFGLLDEQSLTNVHSSNHFCKEISFPILKNRIVGLVQRMSEHLVRLVDRKRELIKTECLTEKHVEHVKLSLRNETPYQIYTSQNKDINEVRKQENVIAFENKTKEKIKSIFFEFIENYPLLLPLFKYKDFALEPLEVNFNKFAEEILNEIDWKVVSRNLEIDDNFELSSEYLEREIRLKLANRNTIQSVNLLRKKFDRDNLLVNEESLHTFLHEGVKGIYQNLELSLSKATNLEIFRNIDSLGEINSAFHICVDHILDILLESGHEKKELIIAFFSFLMDEQQFDACYILAEKLRKNATEADRALIHYIDSIFIEKLSKASDMGQIEKMMHSLKNQPMDIHKKISFLSNIILRLININPEKALQILDLQVKVFGKDSQHILKETTSLLRQIAYHGIRYGDKALAVAAITRIDPEFVLKEPKELDYYKSVQSAFKDKFRLLE